MDDIDVLEIDARLARASREAANPIELSRQIRVIQEELARFSDRLSTAPEADDDPFLLLPDIARKKVLESVEALDAFDPLAPYLKRWIVYLAGERVNRGHSLALAFAFRVNRYPSSAAERSEHTLRELVGRVLERRGPAAASMRGYFDAAVPYAALVSEFWQRRAELASRWKLEPASELVRIPQAITQAASRWLERTRDMSQELRTPELSDLIERGLGLEARLDLPARLDWRSLSDWFTETPLLEALRLESKRLPRRIAPSSFMRGLYRLGEEWAKSRTPNDQPFAIARDPYQLSFHTYGSLFALLLQTPSFLQRRCGASAAALPAALRALAKTVLIESRARAYRVLLRAEALGGRKVFEEAAEVALFEHFGVRVPASSSTTIWSPRPLDASAFAGILLAADLGERLTGAHDDDWFRNPRASDQLLSEAALPPEIAAPEANIERGMQALATRLLRHLG